MKRRHYLALLGGSSAAGSIALGSGAFSSTQAGREVEVAIVGDDDAYLTLEFDDTKNFGCQVDVGVTIRNQTVQPLDTLKVKFSTGIGSIVNLVTTGPGSYNDSGNTVSLNSGSISPGQAVEIIATVSNFSGNATTDFSFQVPVASGNSIAITTTSDRTIELNYNCPVMPSGQVSECPLSIPSPTVSLPFGSGTFSPPSSECADLKFDQSALPTKTTINLSQSPGGIRSDLNSNTGIDITNRVLSDDLTPSRIKEMPDNPSAPFELGGSNPQARIGGTQNDSLADIPGKVILKNDSTVIGELDVDEMFKLKGGSAVAGDVQTQKVETIKNSLLLGDLISTDDETSVAIQQGAVVCGDVDAAGPVSGPKQSRIGGSLTAGGYIDAVNGSTVEGSVTADGKVIIKQNSLVGGDVTTNQGGAPVKIKGSAIDGSIFADGNISAIKSDSKVKGDVEADGNISELNNSTIGGSLRTLPGSGGSMNTVQGLTVGGKITADGAISELKQSEVGGRVAAGGNIEVITGSTVVGEVETTDGGNVKIKQNSTIGDYVHAAGNISAIKGSRVAGDVTASNIDQLQQAEINGTLKATDGTNTDISIKDGSTVCGNVETGGGIEEIGSSQINGTVAADRVDEVKGQTTTIGGNIETQNSNTGLKITSGSTVFGSIDAAGPVPELKQSRVEGNISAGGKVIINECVICTEPGTRLTTTGNVKITGNSDVQGDVETDSNVEELKGSTVDGKVDAGGKVVEVNTSTIEGKLDADVAVEEVKESTVKGTILAGGDVKVSQSDVGTGTGAALTTTNGGHVNVQGNSTVEVPINANGPIKKIKSSIIENTVTTDDKVKKIKDTTVKGNVTANGGSVEKIKDSTIKGDVEANGNVVLGGGNGTTVEGDAISNGGIVTVYSSAKVHGSIIEN